MRFPVQLRFLVFLLLAAALCLPSAGFWFHDYRQAQRRSHLACLEVLADIDAFSRDEARPLPGSATADDGRKGVPETMVRALASRSYLTAYGKTHPDYRLHYLSTASGIVAEGTGDFERSLVEYFRHHPEAAQKQGVRLDEDGREFHYVARPVRFTESCFPCHDSAEDKGRNPARRIGDVDLTLVSIPVGEDGAVYPQRFYSGLMISALIVAMALVLVLFLFHRFVAQPIAALREGMLQLAQGRYDARLRLDGTDTAKELADLFNRMAAAIRENDLNCRLRQEKLGEDNRLWEQIFDVLPDEMAIIGSDYAIVRINRALATLLELRPEEAVGRRCYQLFHDRDTPPADCPHLLLADHPGASVQQHLFMERVKDRRLLAFIPVSDDRGGLVRTVVLGRNSLTPAGRDNEETLTGFDLVEIIDCLSETLLVIDPDCRILLANRRAALLYGIGKPYPRCFELCHGRQRPCPAESCPLQQVLRNGVPASSTHEHGGVVEELSYVPVFDEGGGIARIIRVGRDITEKQRFTEERQRLQAKRFQNLKDRAITTLAGGIAHDFNNGLTGVMGNAELIRLKHRDSEETAHFVARIIESCQKMAQLTKQLLSYARGGQHAPALLDMKGLCERVVKETNSVGAGTVSLLLEGQGPWQVYGDFGQLRQMFDYLLTNAFEATTDGEPRSEIRLARVVKDTGWTCGLGHFHGQGTYLHIEIVDQGCGIAADQLVRVFDPFFTSKFMGRGLGLSAALGIVANHHGCISLESAIGVGTRVHVYLPELERTPLAEGAAQERAPTWSGKVLAVDDEPMVVEYLQEVLRGAGYAVEVAANGFQAVEALRQGDIALVILDVFMPGLSGRATHRQIRALVPDLPVLLSSGYDRRTALAGFELGPADSFIQKPYQMEELLDVVGRLVRPGTAMQA
ncbi:MAG: response regulator [Thermodesulfobacteriota bacterium]